MNPFTAPLDVLAEIAGSRDGDPRFAVLVVLGAAGSTPGRTAARAIAYEDGRLSGTIGGGAVEGESHRRALEAIATGRTLTLDFSMAGDSAADSDPICGGSMRVLIDPHAHRHRAACAAAVEARRRRESGVLLTVVHGTAPDSATVRFVSEHAIAAEDDFPGVETLQQALSRERPMLVVDNGSCPEQRREVLVEPLRPQPQLVIAGGGHVGQAVAGLALAVGFDVLVIDDRPEFTQSERFPNGVVTRCGEIAGQLASLPLGRDAYVVLVTRGHRDDAAALAACIDKPLAYLGMIGSRSKVRKIREEFLQSGLASAAEFDRVYSPIGLDVGSVTVPEIAVSIVAQLIAVRRRGTAPRL
jgi:xanthine dehydrogenase accessory factor